MNEQRLLTIGVECYAGHPGEQTPRALILGDRRIAVVEVVDAWLAPDHRYFKLGGEDDNTYLVRHAERSGTWELTMFTPLRVLGYPSNGSADELALQMLAHLLDDLPIAVEITNERMLASELVSLVQTRGISIICLADLPPSAPSKTRYLVKRLHAALPEVRILVGRWGPPALADDSTQLLRDAGATLVASTLAETRAYLGGLVEIPRIPLPGASSEAA